MPLEKRKRAGSVTSSKASEPVTEANILSPQSRRGRFNKSQHMEGIKAIPISTSIELTTSPEGDLPGDAAEMVETIDWKKEKLEPGDFVLVHTDEKSAPNPAHIFTCWENQETNTQGAYICWYLHPSQTMHKATKTFYSNEVFKTTRFTNIISTDIAGKCFVLPPKAAERGVPKGCTEEHQIFVCRNRYNDQAKSFEPIKDHVRLWPHHVSVERRKEMMKVIEFEDGPRTLTKVPSVFTTAVESEKDNDSDNGENSQPPVTPHNYQSPSREVTPVKESAAEDSEAATAPLTTTPRRRGRPRKNPLSDSAPRNKAIIRDAQLPTMDRPRRSTVLQQQKLHETQTSSQKTNYPPDQPTTLNNKNQQSSYQSETPSKQESSSLGGATAGDVSNNNSGPGATSFRAAIGPSGNASSLPDPSTRPQTQQINHKPPPPAQLANAIVEIFPKDQDGKILWFATPPIVVCKNPKPYNSKAYLEWRKQKYGKS
ncbi:hypothetical protein H4219_000484 [Mycoemilia scoparia]|uniref:BAH domain-containing protein n=1 Tax=Mycoemilia scoparia TaxID=417184 RepID=A0A9W8ABX8_9FUNG|nr:hypothetical protein H4219_000484 [Mycoemilia scoparia]